MNKNITMGMFLCLATAFASPQNKVWEKYQEE
jgi:hypothetical protein